MTRICATALVGVLVLGAGGCGGDDEPATGTDPAHSLEFTQKGGCGDAYFWATTADDERAVVVTAELRDRSASEPTVLEARLPDPAVEVELWRGHGLTSLMCNDVVLGEVSKETSIKQGRVIITLQPRPREPGNLTDGKAELTGLVAEDGTELPDLAIKTTSIGFYAG